MNAVTHLEKVIVGEVSAVTHLEKVIAGETSAVTYTEKVITGEAPPITHLQRVIAGVESPVTHLEYIWAGGTPSPTEHEYTGAVPYTFTANGSPLISWQISGNTVQNGTPTPDNPVMPQGTGERTGNFLDADIYYGTYKQADSTYQSTRANLYNVQIKPFKADDIGKTFTFVADITPITGNARLCANINGTIVSGSNTEKSAVTFTVDTADDSIFFNYGTGSSMVTTLSEIMLVQGSTAPPSYIPYGYKIPISSANTTTPIYLGDVETTRKVKKLVLDGTENYSFDGEHSQITFTVVNGQRCIPYCSHYIGKLVNSWSGLGNGYIAFHPTNSTIIQICDTTITSVADFKSYLAQQYAAGTPVTVWYVLANPKTAVVNEPLMRIGDYADEVSNVAAIPTYNGSTTIDVETAVKPSEIYIKYKGV